MTRGDRRPFRPLAAWVFLAASAAAGVVCTAAPASSPRSPSGHLRSWLRLQGSGPRPASPGTGVSVGGRHGVPIRTRPAVPVFGSGQDPSYASTACMPPYLSSDQHGTRRARTPFARPTVTRDPISMARRTRTPLARHRTPVPISTVPVRTHTPLARPAVPWRGTAIVLVHRLTLAQDRWAAQDVK